MSSTDLKSLKKLAEVCRRLGILHYKDANIEFTLTPDAPVSTYKKKQEELKSSIDPNAEAVEQAFSGDTLTDDQLLLWSSLDPSDMSGNES